MYNADKRSMEYINGLRGFLDQTNRRLVFICCPCRNCKNEKDYSSRKTIQAHIYSSGFMPNYFVWTKHGERGVMMDDDDEEEDDNIFDLIQGSAFADAPMGDAEEEMGKAEGPIDDLGQVLRDAKEDCENVNESKLFERMLDDHKKLLYPDCKQGHKKLGTTLEMLQ